VVEIVVDDGRNGYLLFHPAGERVRGAIQPANVAADDIGKLVRDFPRGIPGAIIGFDPATGTGYIRDPLGTAPELTKEREAVARRFGSLSGEPAKMEYPPAEKRFENAHAGTWLGWMGRAVKAGLAKVAKGELPKSDPPDMRKGFYHTERTDPKDATINQLIGLLAAQLPDAKKKELAALFGPTK
jgi:hypothetical protein